MTSIRLALAAAATAAAAVPALADIELPDTAQALTYGVRPAYLISQMEPSPLRDELQACLGQTPERTRFSIGHRGAPLQFPEHTLESNMAAAAMGAGILECDVTFTADHELVCRHAQNDLHTTTNILATDLAATCVTPFAAASGDTPAAAECRTSELTLAEFLTLEPKMDASNGAASTAEEYLTGTADWRTDLYAGNATLLTHADSIALFDALGADFTPELKSPSVEMPHDGFTQEDYAQALIDDYVAAGIDPSRVWAQSFNLDDVLYWIGNAPEFGAQAVYLIDDSSIEGLDGNDPATWGFDPAALAERGVNYVAPAIPFLLTLDDSGDFVPSALAVALAEADIDIITWTLERSGPLASGGGWYYHSVTEAIDNDGDYFEVLDALAQDVGVVGVFSDWPATVTYYANCMGL
ncbi:glycerophosphodiester phosphodiesterase [Rhodobacterales bacterium HKCCE2091]|nr:glycerophosphodiester phosphodiesterase [Rhodobacterales bacterium HKCCE2091]